MFRILFVCHGNICRSPMAEFIMKKLVSDEGLDNLFHIESAAVSTEEIGNGIFPPARRCLANHGIPFDKMRTAWQISPSDYDRFDLIVHMDASNGRWLRRILSGNGGNDWDPKKKVRLMMSYTGVDRDVSDPWYTGDFEATYRDLTESCSALFRALLEKNDFPD